MEELIGQDKCQILQELSESLNVDKYTVRRRLHSIGLVQKVGYHMNRVLHELTERAIANLLNMSELLHQRHKRKSFLHRITTGDKRWIYMKVDIYER